MVDDQLPLKKMRVRDKDVPYMTTSWKQAIRAKRRASVKYKNHPTQENWENKKKCRNEATRQRRLAIKEHWRKKADDLKVNPRDFFLKHSGHSYQQRVTRVISRFILELTAMS